MFPHPAKSFVLIVWSCHGSTHKMKATQLDVEPVLVLTKWAQKWLRFGWNIIVEGTPTEQIARKIMSELDQIVEEPFVYIEDHIDERARLKVLRKKLTAERSTVETEGEHEDGNGMQRKLKETIADEESVVREVLSRKVVQKIAKRQRSNFSAAVAKQAYNKFGERPMSPANVLVTRKWLHKYLEDQFKDLRTCDKNIAIDRALFLSFVPTKDFLRMRILMETKAAKDRLVDGGFGRVFQLRRGDPSVL